MGLGTDHTGSSENEDCGKSDGPAKEEWVVLYTVFLTCVLWLMNLKDSTAMKILSSPPEALL